MPVRAVVADPPSFSKHKTLGDKLHRLARLAPDDVKAIEVIVDDALRRRLWEHFEHVYNVRSPPKFVS